MTPQEQLEQAAKDKWTPQPGKHWVRTLRECRVQAYIEGGLKGMEIQKEIDQQRWISVKDKLPEEDKSVLIWHDQFDHKEEIDFSVEYIGFYQNGFWYDDITNIRLNASHWMPLPEPPKMDYEEKCKSLLK